MRILYDDQGFLERHGGVSRYFTELMKRLPDGVERCLPLVSTVNAYLQKAPFNLPPHKRSIDDFVARWGGERFRHILGLVYWRCARWLPGFGAGERENERMVEAALRKGDFDVFHMTGPHWVRPDWQIAAGRKPIVVTVHDLVPDMLWGNRRVMECRRLVLAAAARIIAVSENTKRDIIRLYNVPEDKIAVIHHGCMEMGPDPMAPEPPVAGPYLLHVGKRDDYKNFKWLVRVLAPFLKVHDGLRLFCTGSPFRPDEAKLLDRLGIADRVHQAFVTDEQMPALFANAEVFISPSLYEGFGMPILDAFAAGCPAVISNASCFPEVGGDAALYFNPRGDGADLLAHLEVILGEANGAKGIRAELVEKARIRAKGFSWENCVQKTLDVYRQVA